MSYTLSIEEPETKALLERETANVSAAELSALFAMFLAQRHKHEVARRDASTRRRASGRLSVAQRLSGVAKNIDLGDDDHGILARAILEKYERISQ